MEINVRPEATRRSWLCRGGHETVPDSPKRSLASRLRTPAVGPCISLKFGDIDASMAQAVLLLYAQREA